MSTDEIRALLSNDLDALPTGPQEDTDEGWREYDDELNRGLESLADTARAIVASLAAEDTDR